MGQEDAGANQAHKCCNRLDHREVHCAPRGDNTTAASHSQKDSLAESTIDAEW